MRGKGTVAGRMRALMRHCSPISGADRKSMAENASRKPR